MRKNRFQTILLLTILPLFFVWPVIVSFAGSFKLPLRHDADQGEDLRICTACHEADDESFPFRIYEHSGTFFERHGNRAVQNEAVCSMCHQQSFCSDCHRGRSDLKPSIKNHGNPRRRMPHRGDYLMRHRIDGRIDPAKCFGCHGNLKTQRSCRSCHG